MRIRTATMEDLDRITEIEKCCFPAAEAATRQSFEGRLTHYPDRFWLLLDGDQIVGFVNGMQTDERDLRDEMYEEPRLHNPAGRWQMIFGVDTVLQYRGRGCAGMLITHVIEETRSRGCSGLVLTCKEQLLHYYAKFGFVNEGISASVHGNVLWYQMRLEF